MYKTRLQKHFNTRNIPGKLQSTNKPVNCTKHFLSNLVSVVHCVNSAFRVALFFWCCSKLFYLMLLVYCKFSEPATYFTRQWFCKFLSVLSPPNNQELPTAVIEVYGSRGTARVPDVFCNILYRKRTTGNFLPPVSEVILRHSYFWRGKSAVTTYQLHGVNGAGDGRTGNASRLAGLGQMMRSAKELQGWDMRVMRLWWRQPECERLIQSSSVYRWYFTNQCCNFVRAKREQLETLRTWQHW